MPQLERYMCVPEESVNTSLIKNTIQFGTNYSITISFLFHFIILYAPLICIFPTKASCSLQKSLNAGLVWDSWFLQKLPRVYRVEACQDAIIPDHDLPLS